MLFALALGRFVEARRTQVCEFSASRTPAIGAWRFCLLLLFVFFAGAVTFLPSPPRACWGRCDRSRCGRPRDGRCSRAQVFPYLLSASSLRGLARARGYQRTWTPTQTAPRGVVACGLHQAGRTQSKIENSRTWFYLELVFEFPLFQDVKI